MTIISIWIGALFAIVAICVAWRARSVSRRARFALIAAMIACSMMFVRENRSESEISRGPKIAHDAFIGSGACVACHPSEHASWSKTFHRTMTERATDRAMLAHPESISPIVMTTGSHHMQGYWTEDDRGGLHMLPVVFARDEKKLIARSDAFLEPPNAPQHDVRWNSNCIACHATGGRPEISNDATRAPEVGELGIACEACHGAGSAHAELERNPIARYFGAPDLHITNPARLSPERASAVCGACHAYAFPKDEEGFLKNGYADSFRPGDALEPSRILLTPDVLAAHDGSAPRVSVDTDARNLFWPDGTVRVGGREYSSMILSACYVRGEGEKKITCMSCHSMHQSDPDKQLRNVQNACISCHKMPENHSRHAPGTAGDACVSCHMPKTSYALRYAIRSHRIDSPDVANAKPNACNLCHLDKSAAWTRSALREFSVPVPVSVSDSVPDSGSVSAPASVSGSVSADAAERVIWVDAFGDPAARAASGTDWEKNILDVAARDPYAVIRLIAARSAKNYPSSTRDIVSREAIDALVSKRDNRDVYVAE